MKKWNKTCICCGKQYYFCTSCGEFNPDKYWMNLWCSKNCQSVFMIVSDYKMNKLTKDEAKEKLKNCDTTNVDIFDASVRDTVKEILDIEINTPVVEEEQPSDDATDVLTTTNKFNYQKGYRKKHK